MDYIEIRTRALELAIDSYAKLEEPQIATTSEILDRASTFRDFMIEKRQQGE